MRTFHPCYEPLIEHLLSFLPDIDPRFPDLLRPLLTSPFTVKNHLQIFRPGDVADYVFWPVEGFIRTYQILKPEEDRENYTQQTLCISFPKKVAICADSFMNRNPINAHTEIRRGSTMVAFSYSAFHTMAAQIPEVVQLAANIVSDQVDDWKRRVEICRMKGLVGYQAFLDAFTDVESYISKKHIASCMGMTPENLSTIRSKMGLVS